MSKNRALLLDRDGVINVDKAYVGTIDAFEFMPGLFPFLRSIRDWGYRLAILTNQSGVARGLYTEADYGRVSEHMLDILRKEHIEIELILASFTHPAGKVVNLNRESFWRKPNPGMVLEAQRRLNFDPQRSAFLGDNLRDMEAAQKGFIGNCLLLTSKTQQIPQGVRAVKDYGEAFKALSV